MLHSQTRRIKLKLHSVTSYCLHRVTQNYVIATETIVTSKLSASQLHSRQSSWISILLTSLTLALYVWSVWNRAIAGRLQTAGVQHSSLSVGLAKRDYTAPLNAEQSKGPQEAEPKILRSSSRFLVLSCTRSRYQYRHRRCRRRRCENLISVK